MCRDFIVVVNMASEAMYDDDNDDDDDGYNPRLECLWFGGWPIGDENSRARGCGARFRGG